MYETYRVGDIIAYPQRVHSGRLSEDCETIKAINVARVARMLRDADGIENSFIAHLLWNPLPEGEINSIRLFFRNSQNEYAVATDIKKLATADEARRYL